jgi:hypothetical protein
MRMFNYTCVCAPYLDPGSAPKCHVCVRLCTYHACPCATQSNFASDGECLVDCCVALHGSIRVWDQHDRDNLVGRSCWLLPHCFYPARSPVFPGFLHATLARRLPVLPVPAALPVHRLLIVWFLLCHFFLRHLTSQPGSCYQTQRVKLDPTILSV